METKEKIDFFNKFASIIWNDFDESIKALNNREICSLQELIAQLISDRMLVFREDKWRKAYDLLIEEGIVEPMYIPSMEDKLFHILAKPEV